jgi:hypothetical protein
MDDSMEIVAVKHFGTAVNPPLPACIVAVATVCEGEMESWAAYGGGYPPECPKDAGAELVSRVGDKLSKKDATGLFPGYPADLYRE